MPKHYCDYCDVYLTHDSASVRKAHNNGRNHLANVRDYYASLGHDKAQSIIDQITSQYDSGGGPPPGAFNFAPPPGGFGAPPFGGLPAGGMPPFPGPGAFNGPPPGMMGAPPFPPSAGMALPPFPGGAPPFSPPNADGQPPFPPLPNFMNGPPGASNPPHQNYGPPLTSSQAPAPNAIHPDRLRMMGQ
ncbi:YHC1 [Sanghuangporus sanghuang]